MKRIILSIVAVLFAASTFAQIENLKVGGGLTYGTEVSAIGLNINGVYTITDEIDGAITFTHFFEDLPTWNVLDLEGHYTFTEVGDGIGIYGLAGFGITFWSVDLGIFGKTTGSSTGVNLGAGAKIGINDNLSIAPEAKFTIGSDYNYFRLGAAVLYSF